MFFCLDFFTTGFFYFQKISKRTYRKRVTIHCKHFTQFLQDHRNLI